MRTVSLLASFQILVLATLGCAGAPNWDVKIENLPLPQEFQERVRLKNPGTYRESVQFLIGQTVEFATEDYRARTAGQPLAVTADDFGIVALHDKNNISFKSISRAIYTGKIDSSGSAKVSIPYLNVDADAGEINEVLITDTAEAALTPVGFRNAISGFLERHPGMHPDRRYFLIVGVTLSMIKRRVFSETSSDASISGPAFGIGNQMYSSNNQQSLEPLVFLTLRRISQQRLEKAQEQMLVGDAPPDPQRALIDPETARKSAELVDLWKSFDANE